MFLACALSVMALGSASAAERRNHPVGVGGKKIEVLVGDRDHAPKFRPDKAPRKGVKENHLRVPHRCGEDKFNRKDRVVMAHKPPHGRCKCVSSVGHRPLRPTLPPPPVIRCWY